MKNISMTAMCMMMCCGMMQMCDAGDVFCVCY